MNNVVKSAIRHGMPACLILAASVMVSCIGSERVMAQGARERPGVSPVSTPLPEPDMPALIRSLGMPESREPVKVFLKNWHRPKKIVVFPDNNTNRMAWLREVVPPDVKLVAADRADATALKELKDADAQLGAICTKALTNAGGPNFEWVQDNHEGVDACFMGDAVPAKIKPGGTVVVTNIQRVISTAVGYHAVALMLALSRGLETYAREDVTGNFFPRLDPNRLWELKGRTLLVAGLGGIGSTVARAAHDMGMHVIATNGSVPSPLPDYVEYVGLPGELLDLAPKADVVVSGLPLTPATTGIFNAAFFAKMKHGAMFINVTRDEEVIEPDLLAALQSGQVGSAGLDAISSLDANPLLKAPNILVTPHMSGQASDTDLNLGGEVTWEVARENLKRFINGDKLLSPGS